MCRQAGPGGFEKLVAVKRIREEFCLDAEFTTMFLDESRIAALLTHANIAQIYELGLEEDQPFLAMEFVNGRNLNEWLDLWLETPEEELGDEFEVVQVAEDLVDWLGFLPRVAFKRH